MATAKKTPIVPAKTNAAKGAAPIKAASQAKATPAKLPALPTSLKPIKQVFSKGGLQAHLATLTGVDAKAVKAVLGGLELTLLASVSKKGRGDFTLPGLLKVTSVSIPAKKKRRGIDPFTKVEREFAAKPASVRVKVRALKKVKDAAL